jgi:hypothetical protein
MITVAKVGVDPGHQTDHCDYCNKKFEHPVDHEDYEGVQTCTHTAYVTLCEKCYRKAGNSVR